MKFTPFRQMPAFIRAFILLLMTVISNPLDAKTTTINLRWIHTSDVHSSLFGYDYLARKASTGGLSAVYSYVQEARRQSKDNLILTDGGDILQGQPLAYYYNYVDTTSTHLVAAAMNELHYDAACLGNHDIETGHPVYDRFLRDSHATYLGANIIDTRTGEPYLQPYKVVERQGIRIAILGLMTPGIPNWLPESLWANLRFENMVTAARHWVDVIRSKENPDLIVGLFHSGWEDGIVTPEYRENASRQVAEEVDGFDLIFYGHDHRPLVSHIKSPSGADVLCMGPTSQGMRVAEADIQLTLRRGRVVGKKLSGRTPLMSGSQTLDALAFEAEFAEQRRNVEDWIARPIGTLTDSLLERDAYFGPSRFIDVIHDLQLSLTKADVSFAAPISFDSQIPAGPLCVRDMFTLYKYENLLYVMRLSGREIKGFLEMSYGLWTNQMTGPDSHALLLDSILDNGRRKGLLNLSYNMEAAAGIRYDVDLTRPAGERVIIHSMADGSPFLLDKDYRVATNSYRGNGGGELLTRGSGIPHDQLASRIVWSSQKDLRFYLIDLVSKRQVLRPQAISQWQFLPKEWTAPALRRDRKILFPDGK